VVAEMDLVDLPIMLLAVVVVVLQWALLMLSQVNYCPQSL